MKDCLYFDTHDNPPCDMLAVGNPLPHFPWAQVGLFIETLQILLHLYSPCPPPSSSFLSSRLPAFRFLCTGWHARLLHCTSVTYDLVARWLCFTPAWQQRGLFLGRVRHREMINSLGGKSCVASGCTFINLWITETFVQNVEFLCELSTWSLKPLNLSVNGKKQKKKSEPLN